MFPPQKKSANKLLFFERKRMFSEEVQKIVRITSELKYNSFSSVQSYGR